MFYIVIYADKCWHTGILAKLEQIKVQGPCLGLFESYLKDRKQVVVVDGIKSDIQNLEAGVPQGSRLGPLLWILYINDIQNDLQSDVLLFADDTFLFATATDPNQTTKILNQDLEQITTWAKTWKVCFNPGKTKDRIFRKKVLFNSPPILFNDTMIDRVQHQNTLVFGYQIIWINTGHPV